MFRSTPPASNLWTTSADMTFITTGRAERRGDLCGFVGGLHDGAPQQRQPVAFQQRSAFGLRQVALVLAVERRGDQAFRFLHVQVVEDLHLAARDFVQRHQPFGGGQAADRVLGEGVVRDAGLAQNVDARRHVLGPMKEQTTGFLMPCTASGTTAAVSSMSVIDCGVRMTMPMSTLSSSSTVRTADR